MTKRDKITIGWFVGLIAYFAIALNSKSFGIDIGFVVYDLAGLIYVNAK